MENGEGKLVWCVINSPHVFKQAEIGCHKIKIAEPRAQPPLLINLTVMYKATNVPNLKFSFRATCFKFKIFKKGYFFTPKENH